MDAHLLPERRHTRLIVKLVAVVIGMFAFGYALVPLYDVFCDITGLNGKVELEATEERAYEIDLSREVTLEFVTDVNENTAIKFWAESPKVTVTPGKGYTVNFWAENLTDRTMVTQAIPSVSPGLAAPYLKKIECFCFDQQTFAPHEKKLMPLRFVLEPALSQDYKTVSLLYTFFDVTEKNRN